MTTTTRKDAYGETIATVARTPEMMTIQEAARSLGVSTRRFHYVAYRNEITPMVVTGTERNKYPLRVFSPEQVERVAALIPQCDGNGNLKA